MKKFTKFTNVAMLLSLMLLVVSCFKIAYILQDNKVEAEGTFNGWVRICGDGSGNSCLNNYGLFAVRIPEGWSITADDILMKQYAADGTILNYNDNGVQATGEANLTRKAIYNEVYTQMLNNSYPKEGYTWVGFTTESPFLSRLNNDGSNLVADSIVAGFKIKAGSTIGKYHIDYVVGESGTLEAIRTAWDYNTSNDKNTYSATFEPSGESDIATDHKSVRNIYTDANTDIEVTSKTGINNTKKDTYTISAGKGAISIQSNGASLKGADIYVYDNTGKTFAKAKATSSSLDIKISKKGFYLITIAKGNTVNTKRIFIK